MKKQDTNTNTNINTNAKERITALRTEAEALVEELKLKEAEVVAEEVTENQAEEKEEDTVGIFGIFKGLLGTLAVVALFGILIMLMLMHFGKDNNQLPDGVVDTTTNSGVVDTTTPDSGVVDTTTPDSDEITTTVPEFDMHAFAAAVKNIAKTLTSDNIDTNVDIFVEKIGEDKLVELIAKHGELDVQMAIAEYMVFVPEIKMNQYISNNGLDYNLKAENDWYNKMDDAEAVYKKATGKNPEGAFMSLEGYDTYKDNREAMKAEIIKTGDTALLTWYEAKTDGYDQMLKEQRDTEKAHAYKEEVKLELVDHIKGSIKILELQLEQKINGTDVDTLNYTQVYEEFIISNYMYVVAN